MTNLKAGDLVKKLHADKLGIVLAVDSKPTTIALGKEIEVLFLGCDEAQHVHECFLALIE